MMNTALYLLTLVVGILTMSVILKVYRDKFNRRLDNTTKELNHALATLRRYREVESLPVLILAPTLTMARSYMDVISRMGHRFVSREQFKLVSMADRDHPNHVLAGYSRAEIFCYMCEPPEVIKDRVKSGHRGFIIHLVKEHADGVEYNR